MEAGYSRRRSLLHHRPQEHLWHELQDLHHRLGDSIVGPSRSLQGVAEEIVEVDVDEKEIIGSPKTPNKDTNTQEDCCGDEEQLGPCCVVNVGSTGAFGKLTEPIWQE